MNAPELHRRKAAARACLQAGNLGEAFALLQALTHSRPDDPEAWLWLGDCFLANAELDQAARCYQRVATLDPAQADLRARQLWLSGGQLQTGAWKAEPPDADPTPGDPVVRPLAEVRTALGAIDDALAFVSAADVARASAFLGAIVSHPSPAEFLSDHLDEIDRLLPALVTLNIRQARSDGAHAVAEALEQLLIHLQLRAEPGGDASPTTDDGRRSPAPVRLPAATTRPKILVIAGGGQALVPAQALRLRGIEVTEARHVRAEDNADFDTIIVADPHADPDQMPVLAAAARQGTSIVVALSADHARLPGEHADFHRLSLTTPERLEAFITGLQLADLLIAPAEALAEPLRQAGHTVRVIPPVWRRSDGWDLPRPRRTSTHLGWIADPGTHQDVLSIRPELQRAALETGAILVFAGDPLAYQAFTLAVPAAQRAYLPPVSAADLPHVYAQMDVLVMPQRPSDFAAHSSERRLSEAGARGVAWIASPTPAARAWGAGGLIAHSPTEWSQHLNRLLSDSGLRERLAAEGRAAAQACELEAQAGAWANVIELVLGRPVASGRASERLAVPGSASIASVGRSVARNAGWA